MGRLTLHGVYGRFRTDMFTSSLTESSMHFIYALSHLADRLLKAIAIPMGMESKERVRPVMPSAEVLDALANAENYFSAYLKTTSAQGNVVKVREAAVSLALISAFRTSLGDKKSKGPTAMATLLGQFSFPIAMREVTHLIRSRCCRCSHSSVRHARRYFAENSGRTIPR